MTAPVRLCLIGRSVSASPSAAIYNAALAACGIDGSSENIDLTEDAVAGFFAAMRGGAYRGCNVTIPHKARAAAACDALVGDAGVLGVANVVSADGGRLTGNNTDAAGFAAALMAYGVPAAAGREAIVFGAGGAAAAVALALLRDLRMRVRLVARQTREADRIARRLAALGRVDVLAWERAGVAAVLPDACVAVNATPAGVPAMPFDVQQLPASCTVADVRYRPRPVDLVAAASAAGLRACDGAEMVLQQALLSFTLWTGVAAPVAAMRAALEGSLAA